MWKHLHLLCVHSCIQVFVSAICTVSMPTTDLWCLTAGPERGGTSLHIFCVCFFVSLGNLLALQLMESEVGMKSSNISR